MLCCLTLLPALVISSAVAAAERPNFVFIMADELGYFELSLMGHPHIRTPNIDRLAKQGLRFTQCLAGSSLCAPTRCVLMTGKHSGHTSVRTNGGGTPLRRDEKTVASVLKQRGYATGGFGKWGCGGRGSTGVPELHGFDEFVGYYDQVHAHTYYPKYILRNSEEIPLSENQGLSTGKTYSHYVIVDRARDFIRRNKDQPFFCYLPVTPPHGLFDIPDSDPAWAQYRDRDWPEPAKRYAAMVSMVDRQVGELLELLDELSLRENTLVFFCGDNGGNDYFSGRDHPRGFHAPNVNPQNGKAFRGRKGKLYEGGLRIPMIAHWPGRIAPGGVTDHLCYFPDIFPTLAELAGAQVPNDVDGLSLVPTLLGEAQAGREQPLHEYLYWELGQQIAVRQKDWKAVRPRANAEWELYDLASDISEQVDLAARHPDVLARLRTYATAAHEPAVEGTFASRELHEKDRGAKGGRVSRRPRGSVFKLPTEGLIPRSDVRILAVSSESAGNGRTGARMLDGDPRTHWHSQFSLGAVSKHPHHVILDLGRARTITGIRYLARQDAGWNGALAKCDVTVSDSAEAWPEKHHSVEFRKTREAQEARFEAQGRYLRLRIRSEVNGGPWASIAELGVIGR